MFLFRGVKTNEDVEQRLAALVNPDAIDRAVCQLLKRGVNPDEPSLSELEGVTSLSA
jgi:hypothetical protein